MAARLRAGRHFHAHEDLRMEKTCGICGGKTGFRNRFRCQDGVVCKRCYRIVSGNFATTIAKTPLSELKQRYIRFAELYAQYEKETDGNRSG